MIARYPQDLLILVGKLVNEALLSMPKAVVVEVDDVTAQHQHLTHGNQWVLIEVVAGRSNSRWRSEAY